MITTTIMGGIGNFLFQTAMLLAYSIKHNVEYCIPVENINPHYPEQKPFIFPNINYCDTPPVLPLYLEKEFIYNELPPMDGVKFQGYWQSEKYFSNYREEILKAFDIPYEFKAGWVSLQVRRGDYLQLQKFHPPITLEYIDKAIREIKYLTAKRIKLLVVSDDLDWCKENIPPLLKPLDEIEFSEGKTELEDLSLMSCCEHNISSNSSFGWWGHYLNRNENKIGVFPKSFILESLQNDTKDLLPEKSILI